MNRAHIARVLRDFGRKLEDLQAMIEGNDRAEVEEFFQTGKARRDSWAAQCASKTPE